jgi:hypothetical protein
MFGQDLRTIKQTGEYSKDHPKNFISLVVGERKSATITEKALM